MLRRRLLGALITLTPLFLLVSFAVSSAISTAGGIAASECRFFSDQYGGEVVTCDLKTFLKIFLTLMFFAAVTVVAAHATISISMRLFER